ncbi:MAG: GNAT family N-acetyltransferase [Chthoniobacteraceae bacterium]
MSAEGTVTFRAIGLGSPEYRASIRLREAVLRAPLGLTLSAEELAVEPACEHFAALLENEVVATLLLVPLDADTVKMRQVAVNPSRQRSGIGAGLVRFAEEAARERGFRRMVAHARATAVEFYRRLGYAVEDEPFLETTIPHQRVSKVLR